VLHHNETLFDLLQNGDNPTSIYGGILIENSESLSILNNMVKETEKRFSEMFLVKKQDITIKILEQTINDMWNEGWNPEKGDVNLFTTDFGIILTNIIMKKLNGKIIFRSTTDLSDLSIWWKDIKMEVFPFHKLFKRLSFRDGEDLEYFFSQVSKFLNK
jgi:hypothetical protein